MLPEEVNPRLALPLVAAAALAASACGGGGGGASSAAARAAPQQRVTSSQLAVMVVPKRAAGRGFARFVVEEHSGRTSLRELAEATIDPKDTPGDLRRGGWRDGYELTYLASDVRALRAAQGNFLLDSSVDLFTTAGAAKRFFAEQLADLRRFEGKRLENDITLVRAETFPVKGLGDEAMGIRASFRIKGGRLLHATYVDFRVGRLIGEVDVARADLSNVDALVLRLARTMERRMDRSLRGKLGEQPVLLPKGPAI